MHRFFVPPSWIQPPLIRIQGETARQIAIVLRLKPGDIITILDGSSLERKVRINSVSKSMVAGEIISETPTSGEPRVHLTLYVSLTQRSKFEWILQKGSELGVSSFVPVITSRSLVRETTDEHRKFERWEGILREAAEQSARGRIPELRPTVQFARALEDGKRENDLCLIAWEMESEGNLKKSLSVLERGKPASVGILIGPEGGLADDEAHLAIMHGWQPISLGRRILRMETAALTLSALILYELDELKPPGDVAAGS